MILSPGCMYAVQRQRYEQKVDKSIHDDNDYRQGDDTQMIDRPLVTELGVGVSTATTGKFDVQCQHDKTGFFSSHHPH